MTRRSLATVFAVLLVTSAALAGLPASAAAQAEDDGLDPADDAYVTDDGDVILVYANDSEDARVEFGVDVSKNLFYALAVTEETKTSDVTGEATAWLQPDELRGNGSLVTERPDALTSLSLDVTATQNAQNAKADASLAATISNENASAAGLVKAADVSGEVRVEPNAFTARTEFEADLVTQLGPPRHESFTLAENDGVYTLQASREYAVPEYAQDRWRTEARARKMLEAQYGAIARSLGGQATVTLESYEYTNTSEGARLDIEFTVEYTGIEEGLRTRIVDSLQRAEQYDLTRAEAAAVADGVVEMQIDEISAQFDQSAGQVSGSFTAKISDYDGAVRGLITVGRAFQPEGADANLSAALDRLEKSYDARRAAGLVQTYTFSVELRQPDRRTTKVAAEFAYRTENWDAYVSELKARGIKTGSSSVELHAATQGEQVTVEAAFTIKGEDLLKRASQQALNVSDEPLDPRTKRFVRALGRAGFEKARMDVRLTDDGRVRLETGATFQNMTALRDALVAEGTIPADLSSVVGRTEGDTVYTYVKLEGAVSADASKSDVRALAAVDDDTTIHMPGSYNRSFPEMDAKRARDYLELSPTPEDGPDEGTNTGLPGFGPVVALIALVAIALLARRQD